MSRRFITSYFFFLNIVRSSRKLNLKIPHVTAINRSADRLRFERSAVVCYFGHKLNSPNRSWQIYPCPASNACWIMFNHRVPIRTVWLMRQKKLLRYFGAEFVSRSRNIHKNEESFLFKSESACLNRRILFLIFINTLHSPETQNKTRLIDWCMQLTLELAEKQIFRHVF